MESFALRNDYNKPWEEAKKAPPSWNSVLVPNTLTMCTVAMWRAPLGGGAGGGGNVTAWIINPFAPGDFAEKRVLKLVEWFSGLCRAIKS